MSDKPDLARAVSQALPIDEEMDNRVTRALNKRPDGYVPRKLTPPPNCPDDAPPAPHAPGSHRSNAT